MPPLSELHYHDAAMNFEASTSLDSILKRKTWKAPLDHSVRFAEYDEVFEIPHIKDLSQDEINDIWLSEKDNQAIQRKFLVMVELMNNSDDDDDDDERANNGLAIECRRGLEDHTRRRSERRRQIRNQVYEAVFSMQASQEATSSTGERAPDLQSELTRKYSRISELQARIVASRDAVDVYH
jgi:hypothetical protein